jgi:serine protease Do
VTALRRGLAVAALVLLVGPGAGAADRYGWLGVRIRDLSEAETEDLSVKLGVREGYGVMIQEILPDTPAQVAGLRAGDLVVSIEGHPVVESRTLQRVVGSTPAGRELRLTVLRDGRKREVRVRVGAMPGDVTADRVAAEFGFFIREPGDEPSAPGTARPARVLPIVADVAERSPAGRGGLRKDDRIRAINGVAVASLEAVRRVLQDVSLRDSLRLDVERAGEPQSLVLPPAQSPSLPH